MLVILCGCGQDTRHKQFKEEIFILSHASEGLRPSLWEKHGRMAQFMAAGTCDKGCSPPGRPGNSEGDRNQGLGRPFKDLLPGTCFSQLGCHLLRISKSPNPPV